MKVKSEYVQRSLYMSLLCLPCNENSMTDEDYYEFYEHIIKLRFIDQMLFLRDFELVPQYAIS